MEMIPLENMEPMDDNSYLGERAQFARNKQIDRRLTRPKLRETLKDQVDAAFELIGGVPRLAIEADEQPWELYRMRARLETAAQTKKHEHAVRLIAPGLPPTELDGDGAIDVEVEDIPTSPPKT